MRDISGHVGVEGRESGGVGANRGQGAHGAEVGAAWASYVQF